MAAWIKMSLGMELGLGPARRLCVRRSYPRQTGADLGFYKSGCPIHLKGAPEGTKPPTCAPTAALYAGDVGLSPENLKI